MEEKDRSQLARLIRLLHGQRWAALATVDARHQPTASMVGYALAAEADALYLHLSRLAAHTAHLLARPEAALVVGEHDTGHGDPQQLARVSLSGRVETLPRESAAYAAARVCYLARLPDAAPLFDFPDFILFRLAIVEARFVGGFAQARTFTSADLRLGAARFSP